MKTRRLRYAQTKGPGKGSKSNDFISQMPDDVLVMILSLLPIKDAAVTSTLSTRWRFLWCNLIQLNFDGTESFDKMAKDEKLCLLEQAKYITQVDDVISSYNHPTVQVFRIRFDLDDTYTEYIDEWLQFAVDKKVEKLELDLLDNRYHIRDPSENYIFPSPLSNAMVVEMLSLKNLFLKGVNMNEQTLIEILKVSPHLEKLSIYGSGLFTHFHIGGWDINLKHFEITNCSGVESISLYDFDLVSFTYINCPEIELRLTDLPNLKELDIGEVSVGLKNNVFNQISSCASSLQVLILDIDSPKESLNVNAIPELPNVKKLMLIIGAEKDDSLLEFTSIAKACPSLETFSISLLWFSPIKRRRKVRHVANPQPHENLKLFQIMGYYGRISDLELAVYVIDNALALKKIVIDPCCHAFMGDLTRKDLFKREKAARSSAKRQLTPILPRGVDLAIL